MAIGPQALATGHKNKLHCQFCIAPVHFYNRKHFFAKEKKLF